MSKAPTTLPPPSMFALIASDVRQELAGLKSRSILAAAYVTVFSRSLHVLYLYRLAFGVHNACSRNRALWRFFLRPPFELAYRFLCFFICNFKGIEIPYTVRAGRGLRLVHPFNIVLTPQTILGDYCTIFNGVTCGVNHLDRSGYPRIGSHVVLYPGCKVVGNVAIGDTVVIGANSVVVRDIESNSIAAGMPAVVKKKIDSLDALQW